jgi:hypothetical protein
VREESQLEDMRSAIRGDFERLAERRGAAAAKQPPSGISRPETRATESPVLRTNGEQELMRASDEEALELEAEATPESPAEDEPRRPWFARFVGS